MPGGSIDYCNQRLLDYASCAMNTIEGERFYETLHPEDQKSASVVADGAGDGRLIEGRMARRVARKRPISLLFTRGVPVQVPRARVLRWYGTNTDIEGHKKAEQALMRTQTELAHLLRVLTMGELTSSIAHEVNQPLTAVVTYGHACLEFSPPIPRICRKPVKLPNELSRMEPEPGRFSAVFAPFSKKKIRRGKHSTLTK